MASILLSGAAGYIGSHTWLALLQAGHTVVGLDNFCNSSPAVLPRLQALAGGAPLVFEQVDLRDAAALHGVFQRHRVDAVVHFAALKAVGESVAQPLDYYGNNLGGLVNLCRVMGAAGTGGAAMGAVPGAGGASSCKRIVFSSSATVYGSPEWLPLREDAALCATNPYGQTKLMGETILRDVGVADAKWRTVALRYFNPVGAHESGQIGEDPRGTPNNLMPYVAQVAVGRREFLSVFGNDYDTPDGTGVRDYIHVVDLAEGHVAALNHLLDGGGGAVGGGSAGAGGGAGGGCVDPKGGGESLTVNLGTGVGTSVLQLVDAYAKASGRPVPYRIAPRRPGDIAACWADPTLAQQRLGWRARHGLERMCADSWRWQSLNPRGFEG